MNSQELKVTKEMIDESRRKGYCVHGIKKGYCDLHSSCDECNKKVRFWCRVITFIEDLQTEIIKKLVNWNSEV